MQTSNPSTNPRPKALKKLHEISIPNQTTLNQQIKINSRTITKSRIDPLESSSQTAKDRVNLPKMRTFRKIASIFQQEKFISSLICSAVPTTPSEITFLTSTLKYLKNITSLELQLLRFCTPHFLKYPSIILNHLKDLTTFTLNILSRTNLSPQHIKSLFFGLRR